MELAADTQLLQEVFDGALLVLEGALVLIRLPLGLLVLVAREGAGGLLDAALGLVRRSFVLVLPAALGHLFLPFFGWSSKLDLGLEELKNHYYQYDDHHYPDDPVRHALTSSGLPVLLIHWTR